MPQAPTGGWDPGWCARTHTEVKVLNHPPSPSGNALTKQPLWTCPHSKKELNDVMNDKLSGIHIKVGWGKKKKHPLRCLAHVYQPLSDKITLQKWVLSPLFSNQDSILFQQDVRSQRVGWKCPLPWEITVERKSLLFIPIIVPVHDAPCWISPPQSMAICYRSPGLAFLGCLKTRSLH